MRSTTASPWAPFKPTADDPWAVARSPTYIAAPALERRGPSWSAIGKPGQRLASFACSIRPGRLPSKWKRSKACARRRGLHDWLGGSPEAVLGGDFEALGVLTGRNA
jgi:hypothetical protein